MKNGGGVHAGPVYARREYRKIFVRKCSPYICQILGGIHVGANTGRSYIRTRANTGQNSWRISLYWFRVRGHHLWLFQVKPGFMATIRVIEVNIFAWMDWMSEAFARDCQVHVWMDKTSLLAAERNEPVNEEECSDTFAREWRKVNGGH